MNEQAFDEIFSDEAPRELSPAEASKRIADLCTLVCHAARDVMSAIRDRDRIIEQHRLERVA
jgi:hypothetical protein